VSRLLHWQSNAVAMDVRIKLKIICHSLLQRQFVIDLNSQCVCVCVCEADGGEDTASCGCCSYVLLAFSWLLIVCTFPFSLVFSIKVSAAAAWAAATECWVQVVVEVLGVARVLGLMRPKCSATRCYICSQTRDQILAFVAARCYRIIVQMCWYF